MRSLLRSASMAVLLALPPALHAAHTHFLLRDRIVCSARQVLCLRATLSHNDLSNRLELSGRVQQTTVPGTLIVKLRGTTTAGLRVYTEMTISLRGRYSEIVNKALLPDAPSQTEWQIERLLFVPA